MGFKINEISKVYDFWHRLSSEQKLETGIATKREFAEFFGIHEELIKDLEKHLKRQNSAVNGIKGVEV